MQTSLDQDRQRDGSTDFGVHIRRAGRWHRRIRPVIVRHVHARTSAAAKAGASLAGVGAIAAVLLTAAAWHAYAQGSHAHGQEGNHAHAHHTMLLPGEMKWAPGPGSLPPGSQFAMLEGNPAQAGPFTMRLRFPAGYKVAPHTHPAIEHITVLSGTFHMGAGETFDERKGKRLPAGSFLVMPTGMAHFAWVSEDTVIQLHGMGPWGVTYLNPADDPRPKK